MDAEVLRQVMEELIPFNRYVGVRVVEIDRGRVRIEVPFRPELIGDPLRQAMHGAEASQKKWKTDESQRQLEHD